MNKLTLKTSRNENSFVNEKTGKSVEIWGTSCIARFMYSIHDIIPSSVSEKSNVDIINQLNKFNFARVHFQGGSDKQEELFLKQAKEDFKLVGWNSTGMWVDESFYLDNPDLYHFVTLNQTNNMSDEYGNKKNYSILTREESWKIVHTPEWRERVAEAFRAVERNNIPVSAFIIGNEVVWQRLEGTYAGNDWPDRINNIEDAIEFYEKFAQVTTEECRKVFPDILISVNRTSQCVFGKDKIPVTGPELGARMAEISAEYGDFLSANIYPHYSENGFRKSYNLWHNEAERLQIPFLVTECSWHARGQLNELWEGLRYNSYDSYPQVLTQEKRGLAMVQFYDMMMKSRWCLGVMWYSYLDHVDINWGVRDTMTNYLYDDFVDVLRKKFVKIHRRIIRRVLSVGRRN